MKKVHAWLQAHHHLLVLAALVAAVAAAALSAVVLSRGTATKTTVRAAVQAISPQQAPAAKVVAKAPVPAATKAQDMLPCPPPPGEGVLGVCTPKPVIPLGAAKVVPATVDPPASIPDVSSWQGHPNWGSVVSWQRQHGFAPAGIFKIGEYGIDPDASYNSSSLKSLGAFRMGYWFVRNTGCTSEGGQIINEAHALGLTIVDLDMEVGEARGYATCLVPRLRAAGFTVVVYTAPGTWTGDALSSTVDSWMAAYSTSATPPRTPWGGPIKAWQCTDGVFGCVTYVPGVGRVDVSVDYGLTKLGGTVAPTKPDCSKSMCYFRFSTATFTNHRGVWCSKGCIERSIAKDYQAKRPFWRKYHAVLLDDRYRMQWLAHRLSWLIANSTATQNRKENRYSRRGYFDAAGFRAWYRTSLNAYLACKC